MSLIADIPKTRNFPNMGKYRGLMNAFIGNGRAVGDLVAWRESRCQRP